MKGETGGVTMKKFVGLKPKMYSFLVDDSSEHRHATGLNENAAATINHGENRNVLLNKKYMRISMNRIQINDHRTETYKINKISLSCFDDKTYIQNNGYDVLALGYQGYLWEKLFFKPKILV